MSSVSPDIYTVDFGIAFISRLTNKTRGLIVAIFRPYIRDLIQL